MIALASLGAILYNDEYRPGVYGVLAVYVVALAYFAIAGRHKLVLSPEEEFAMTQGRDRPSRRRKATVTPGSRATSTRTSSEEKTPAGGGGQPPGDPPGSVAA